MGIRGFPKLGVPFSGVPIIRTILFWGLYWGPLILGNYHLSFWALGFRVEGLGAAVKGLNLSSYIGETMFITICTHYSSRPKWYNMVQNGIYMYIPILATQFKFLNSNPVLLLTMGVEDRAAVF